MPESTPAIGELRDRGQKLETGGGSADPAEWWILDGQVWGISYAGQTPQVVAGKLTVPAADDEGVPEKDGREGWQEPDWKNDEKIELTHEQVCGLAFQAAGAGSAAIMSKDGPAGEVVMPTEEINSRVSEILHDFGVDVALVKGYHSAGGNEDS